MSEIRVERLTKSFKNLNAVDDVTFAFPESQVTCLLGPSGCGKTTTLRLIAGLAVPDSGSIAIDQRIASAPAKMCSCGRSTATSAWCSSPTRSGRT
jgi:ABC-type Fe3+/spermidine/putrescine transport system ATPase subunit